MNDFYGPGDYEVIRSEFEDSIKPPADVQAAYDAINETRRLVMNLYGGNLDHPALDHLESAMVEVMNMEEHARVLRGYGLGGYIGEKFSCGEP